MSDTKKEEIILGKDNVELIVRNPTLNDIRGGKKVYNNAFNDAINSNALVRARLDDFLKKQGLWNDEKALKLETLKKEILEHELSLESGGIKLSSAREIALSMIKLRSEIRNLIYQRSQLDNNTAEGQAENAQFDYLVSACLVYKDSGKPYFSNLEDYLNSTESVGLTAAQQLSSKMYGLDDNYESKLPEYKFLKKFNFIDEKLHFINKEGKLVDIDGRLVNDKGQWIGVDGTLVDIEGRPVNDDGTYRTDIKPFLDDDGKEIVLDTKPESVEQPVLVEVDSDLA